MNQTVKTAKLFSWLFLSTGIFAIVGALYTWGDGPIYQQKDLLAVLVPWADLLITGPLSLLAAYGVWKRALGGFILGLLVSGIYLFGSGLVWAGRRNKRVADRCHRLGSAAIHVSKMAIFQLLIDRTGFVLQLS